MSEARPRGVAALTAVLALLGALGCSPQAPGPEPSDSPSPGQSPSQSEGYGTRYVLPEALCDAVALEALTEVYPEEATDNPLRLNTTDRCDTLLRGGARRLSVSMHVLLQEVRLLEIDPALTREHYDRQLERATFPPTEIDGVGSGAFSYSDGNNELWLEAYDGNLNLRLYISTLAPSDPLDPDMPDRLAAVAAGTLAALSS